MKRCLVAMLLAAVSWSLWASGGTERSASTGAHSAGRASYLAGRGVIVPPAEVKVGSYIAAVDYEYPKPVKEVGVQLHTGHKQVSSQGQEEIIQIGIQARQMPFDELPPLNLAFVIDTSTSMSDSDKIGWVKRGFSLFLGKVRDFDYVSLVIFNDEARVMIPATRMSNSSIRRRFKEAVDGLATGGGSNILDGINLGYQQVMTYYRSDYTNRVILLSDGTEFSARLRGAKAKSGNLRFSLLWDNRNDLDLHVITPAHDEIHYANRYSRDGGMLDVDMNVEGESTKPVENIYWATDSAPDGEYEVFVHYYGVHDIPSKRATSFIVEVFNNGETSHYEGRFLASQVKKKHPIARIRHRTMKASGASGIYGIAERYKELGINISTVGVGLEFDADLMTRIAEVGGGSSRFISDEAEAVKTFDTDFDRMVVPAVRDCQMTLSLSPGVQLLGTWGYNNRTTGNVTTYDLPTLHHRDYETILAHVRVSPGKPLGRKSLGTFTISYADLLGRRQSIGPTDIDVEVVGGPPPVSGFSDGMVMKSGTLLHFADALKRIGLLYYAIPEGMPDPGRLNQAIDIAIKMRNEMKNVELRLGAQTFPKEIGILDKYLRILRTDFREAGGDTTRIVQNEELAPTAPGGDLSGKLSALFREVSLEMQAKQRGSVAVSGFAMKGKPQAPLIGFLNESALLELAKATNLKVVERERLDSVMKEQKLSLSDLMDTTNAVSIGQLLSARFILTGTVIEMPETIVIFARIVNVETSQVESAAQVIVPKSREVSSLL